MVNKRLGEASSLNHHNAVFSNVNVSKDVWWFTIPPQKFVSELHVLLAKKDDSGLIWLRIRANAFPNLANVFRKRADNGKVHWEICSDDTDALYMRDTKNVRIKYDFRPHIAQEWDDVVADRKPDPDRKHEPSRRPKPKPRIARNTVIEVRRDGKRVYYAGDVLPPLVDLDQVGADGPVFEGTDVPVAYMFAYLDVVGNLHDFLQDFPQVSFEQGIAAMRERARANIVAHSDVEVMGGTPVFKGSRLPVATMFEYLANGYTIEGFLDSFATSVTKRQAIETLTTARELLESLAYENSAR